MAASVQDVKETQGIEPYFHQFFQDVIRTLPKVDPELVVRVLLLEVNLKKYSGYSIPHVNLYVKYKEGTDLGRKQEEGRDKYPIEVTVSRWDDGVIFSGLMGMKHVQKIVSDPDIVSVTGKASPRHN